MVDFALFYVDIAKYCLKISSLEGNLKIFMQSMISQTQSLGGPPLEHEVPGHPPGGDVGQMSVMMQRLGQDAILFCKVQSRYNESMVLVAR